MESYDTVSALTLLKLSGLSTVATSTSPTTTAPSTTATATATPASAVAVAGTTAASAATPNSINSNCSYNNSSSTMVQKSSDNNDRSGSRTIDATSSRSRRGIDAGTASVSSAALVSSSSELQQPQRLLDLQQLQTKQQELGSRRGPL
eukprot:GHVU01217194.1.p1 GENE.GHVU01217194.1~~GHVU01217194.1.p1  ORF type:complete len:148 (-),score=30.80 GHVU01217194.1:125-568(-)